MNMRPSKEFTRLNVEQNQALDWTRSIAIRANAGSGKTTVLVQRIVQIFHNHRELKLDNIAAITFTRKAGGQLKQKLDEALTECVQDSTTDEDREYWQARLDELPRCRIGTIDALCHRILKESIDAGMITDLDPAFGILEGIDRAELLDQVIRTTEIELKDETSPAHEAWNQWLKTQGRYELNRAVRKLLNTGALPEHLLTALNAFEQTGFDVACGMLRLKALVKLSSHFELVKREIRDAIAELQALPAKERAYKAIININDALQALLNDPSGVSLPFLNKLRDALLTKTGEPRTDKLYVDEEPKSPTLHRLSHEWQTLLKGMRFDDQGQDGLEPTRQLIQIYEVAHRYFHTLCREENRYDYNFLAQRVVDLLSNQNHARRLTDHYRFILVDEFQDTNEQQWRIVAGLAGVDPSAPVTGDKLMIVGDPQQSIYRFRQADPTVFERIIGLIQNGNSERKDEMTAYDRHMGRRDSSDEQRLGLMRLRKNYRSRTPLPIRLIDKLSFHAFGSVNFTDPQHLEPGLPPSNEHTEVVYVYPKPIEADAADPVDDEAAADFAQPNDEQPPAEQLDPSQLELVTAELIRQHRQGSMWKNMAILLRSRRTHLVNLEKVLREACIPYQLVGGLGFWQRQEVRDLVCLANCLANGADELALFAVLRGPLCGLNDSELLFLSMLGGRKLLNGLHRFALMHTGESPPGDWHADEAMATALRTAFEQTADDRKSLIRQAAEHLDYDGTWRQRVDRMPHSDLLMTALDESGAWGVYTNDPDEGERRLANLRLFFDEVRLFETNRAASLADTARRLKTLVDKSTDDEQAELTPDAGDAVQVMTVHAAKGLEFHVVAVIGLERRFNLQGESMTMLDRFQHFRDDQREGELAESLHGLPVISFRDPAMPLQRIRPLLHQALGKIERELSIEEETRIFHVAITRAERVLILAGAAPKGKTWPPNNSWQKWVHDALNLDRDIAEDSWHDPADPTLRLRIVRQTGMGATKADGPEKPAPAFDLQPLRESPRRRIIAATALPKMLELCRDHRAEWEMRYRFHVQPHARSIPRQLIDGKKRDAGDEIGKLVGTLVHRALEMGAAFPKSAKDRRALLMAHAAALLNDRGADPDEPGSADLESTSSSLPQTIARSAEKILESVLPNNPFKGLLDAEGESEIDFALPLGDWIITGRFDRLKRGADGAWEIVDWKTDAGSADAIVRTYRDQMKLYALALLESLPETARPSEIVVHLAMTASREARRLDFAASELDAYRRELEKALPPVSRLAAPGNQINRPMR
jgi:ATP-dependent exoDNAse (exonuclease V) beta subunit